ncbi:hypothetical protein GCM10027084_06350 [Pseudoxanthomonas sangjuensis]
MSLKRRISRPSPFSPRLKSIADTSTGAVAALPAGAGDMGVAGAAMAAPATADKPIASTRPQARTVARRREGRRL